MRYRNLVLLTTLHGVLGFGMAVLVLSLATGGYPLTWLNYIKNGVASDNFWYFESPKLLDFNDVFKLSDISF